MIVGKAKHKTKFFPNRIEIEKQEIFDQKTLRKNLWILCKHKTKLSKKILIPKAQFESYIQYNGPDFHGSELTDEELEKA